MIIQFKKIIPPKLRCLITETAVDAVAKLLSFKQPPLPPKPPEKHLITNIGNRRCYFEFGHNDSGTEHHTFARVIVMGEDGQMLRIEKPILAYAHDSVEALAICTDVITARTNKEKRIR